MLLSSDVTCIRRVQALLWVVVWMLGLDKFVIFRKWSPGCLPGPIKAILLGLTPDELIISAFKHFLPQRWKASC